jgi:enamine deaminase RidA (YjgF/YER057c/UK114 family)
MTTTAPSPEEKLAALGIELRAIEKGNRPLIPYVLTGNLLYLSGSGPNPNREGKTWVGQVGSDFTAEEGYQAARDTAINLLSTIKSALGDLGRVRQVVKVLGMVNSAPGFSQQPQVINGFSELIVEVFGERGRHARSAVGMAGLPGNMPVEIEMILEVE